MANISILIEDGNALTAFKATDSGGELEVTMSMTTNGEEVTIPEPQYAEAVSSFCEYVSNNLFAVSSMVNMHYGNKIILPEDDRQMTLFKDPVDAPHLKALK